MVGLLEAAIEQDPEFALAHVALADALRLVSNYGSMSATEADDRGMREFESRLEIDDDLGEAYASLGNLLVRQGDLNGAEAAFLRGIELSPNYALCISGMASFSASWRSPVTMR